MSCDIANRSTAKGGSGWEVKEGADPSLTLILLKFIQDEYEQLFFTPLDKYSAPVSAREGARRKMPTGHFRALPGEIYYSSNLKY